MLYLNYLERSETIEVFNKKALYISIREMYDVKPLQLPK